METEHGSKMEQLKKSHEKYIEDIENDNLINIRSTGEWLNKKLGGLENDVKGYYDRENNKLDHLDTRLQTMEDYSNTMKQVLVNKQREKGKP